MSPATMSFICILLSRFLADSTYLVLFPDKSARPSQPNMTEAQYHPNVSGTWPTGYAETQVNKADSGTKK